MGFFLKQWQTTCRSIKEKLNSTWIFKQYVSGFLFFSTVSITFWCHLMAIDEVLQQRILSSKSCVTDTISVTAETAYDVSKYLDHSPMSPCCNFSGVLIREVRLG